MKLCLTILSLLLAASSCRAPSGGASHAERGYVSLSPAVTENLFLLGVGDRLVGNTTYCKYPLEARRIRKVGNLMQPNIEEIIRLNPEIVFTSEMTPPDTVKRMKNLGLRVVNFMSEHSVDEVQRSIERLGRETGRVARARQINAQMRRDLKNVMREAAPDKPKIFIEVGANPLVTAGPDTFLDELISLAGGVNVAADLGKRYAVYSREEVVRRDPDVLLLVTMGDVSRDEVDAWKRFQSLRAVRRDRFCVLDADVACRPTPTAVVQTLGDIVSCLRGQKLKRSSLPQ